jgi:hypothetical protein
VNIHPRRQQYDTVERSERKPTGNIQSNVGYRVCFGTGGDMLCKSRDVERVRDAASVFSMRGTANAGVDGKKGYIYSSSGDFLVQGSTYQFCCLRYTKRGSFHLATEQGTS